MVVYFRIRFCMECMVIIQIRQKNQIPLNNRTDDKFDVYWLICHRREKEAKKEHKRLIQTKVDLTIETLAHVKQVSDHICYTDIMRFRNRCKYCIARNATFCCRMRTKPLAKHAHTLLDIIDNMVCARLRKFCTIFKWSETGRVARAHISCSSLPHLMALLFVLSFLSSVSKF